MKTKYLLSALALPALLAACVNDDFETQNQASSIVENDLLKGRAMGELVVSADKYGIGNEADTRVNGVQENGGINWYWQPGDQLGAVVVNYGGNNRDEIVNGNADYVITNFPFNANLNEQARRATFSTPTAVVEGAYFFYNQYDREGIRRGKIQHSLNQYIDVKSGTENTGLIQVGTDKTKGQNFFISPITKVAVKDGEGEAMTAPVSLQSIYTVLDMKFNLELNNEFVGKDVKIYKVELERSEAEGKSTKKFRNNFTLDPLELAKLQREVKDENPNAAWAAVLQPADEDGSQTEAAVIDATNLDANRQYVEQAMAAVLEKMKDPQTLADCFDEGETKLIYQLETPYSFKENNGEQMQLMVLVPSDIYRLNSTEENRDGHNKGVLKMTVYTSEGIYRSYVIDEKALENWGATHEEYVEGQYAFQRGSRVGTTKTIRIGGDKSNITFYDFQKEGFPVATTADWNYAIDYINEHTSQFGGGQGGDHGNEWNFPILNLSNYNDKPIEVDADHYFPNMRVIYNGDAVLKLVNQSEYKLNPRNMIFGTDDKRPTILIEEQSNSTVTFDYTSEKPATIKDGENYTEAWKLDSDAKINVAEGQEVSFELLTTDTEMNIGKGATVKVYKGDALTNNGTITLAEGEKDNETTLNVGGELAGTKYNSILDNNADASLIINKYATVNLNGGEFSENDGLIDVTGRLNAYMLNNNEGATLNVHSWEVEMDNNIRGIAKIDALMNEGTIDIEKRKQNDSGTYGGELIVSQTLDNRNQVTVNGLLTVDGTTAGYGLANQKGAVITLGSDPYAQIVIKNNKGSYDGIIVLNDPTEYEFYDGYLNGSQKLDTYKGVIQATLNQEDYDEVMENYDTYNTTGQETAWDVINKVIVDGNLNLGVEMGEKPNGEESNKDFFLADGATLNAQGSLTLESLTTEGAATLTAQNANTVVTVKKNVNVAAKTSLTVAEKVKLALNYGNGNVMLNVAGTLTNNGWIESADDNDNTITFDPEFDTAQKGVIYANIKTGATLKNLGKLSRKSEAKYSKEKDPAYGRLENLVELLYRGDDKILGAFAGTFGNGPRVEVMDYSVDNLETFGKFSTTEDAWKKTINHSGRAVKKDVLLNLLANGKEVTIRQDGQSYSALAVQFSSSYPNYSYVLYLPEGFDSIEGIVDLTDDARQTACDIEDGSLETMPYLAKTWFYVENAGVLNLSESVWAYGHLKQMTEDAGLFGDFTNK